MKGMKLRMIERGVEKKLGKSEYGVESWFLECNKVLVLSLIEAVFRRWKKMSPTTHKERKKERDAETYDDRSGEIFHRLITLIPLFLFLYSLFCKFPFSFFLFETDLPS